MHDSAEQSPRHWTRGFGVSEHDLSPLQVATTVAIIAACALTVGPHGWSGSGLAVTILLVLNSVLLLTRHVPATVVDERSRLVLLWLGILGAAALVALARDGVPYLFGFYVAGHAGYRLSAERSVPIAAACSVLCGGVLLLHIGPGYHRTPWFVGAAMGFAVLLGMVNRTQRQLFESALAAASAAERASAAEAREAVLAERGRIARDVHDVLAHSLAGINMQLEMADALLDAGDLDRVRQATRTAQSLVRESLVESRRTVSTLREDVLPLLDTLRAMLPATGRLSVVGDEVELATRPTQALIRIAQESLTNAARHAPGAAVLVEVAYEPEQVRLKVANDAPTGPVAASPGSGMGLVGMRERAALLGGTVQAGPVADGAQRGGWQVTATFPAGKSSPA